MVLFELIKELLLYFAIGCFILFVLLIEILLFLPILWWLIKLSGYKEEDGIVPGYDENGKIIN